MKINILDSGLSDRAGHHYDYDLKLVRHWVETGHDVHVYGFAGLDNAAAREFEKLGATTRLFDTDHYKKPNTYDWYAGEIVQHRRESANIAEELKSVRQADIWIWPTMRAQEIAACVTRGVDVPVVGCIHSDPGVEARSLQAQLWRDALLSARDSGLQLTLASVEAELRHRFMPIVANGRFVVVPHPVDGPPIAEPRTALKRVGFFGHQRNEKGLKLMPSLLSQLVEDGFAITFQNSRLDSPMPDVPGVDLLDYVEDLAVPIAQCDLVVLPYDVEKYHARGSGILVQCLALGIPVTAPVGTLPARIIEQYRLGPLFIANSAGYIYRAIKAAERQYPAFAINAHRTAGQFCKRNGSARFAADLLAAANR